jgi:alpha-beta hydrolase superfamily lysophospholipase
MPRILRKAAIGIGSIVLIYLLVAMGLTLAPAPKLSYQPPQGPTPRGARCRDGVGIRCIPMRDGALLATRQVGSIPADSGLIVVLLHGIMSTGAELEETALRLQASTGATVVRLDLRGHGLSAGTPGDVDHIGQWEEDVTDVISTLHKESPGARILLAGHSMGGGIAMRYAERLDVPGVEGYLLFAPHLGDKSPTTRKEPAGGTNAPQPIRVNVPRILGLVMLNVVGIRGLNGLDTLYFDIPIALPFRAYTFRALASVAPDDYRAALAADAKPMLVLVGQNDEAFRANEYPAVIALHRNGKTVIIPGETHDGVIRSDAAFAAIREWRSRL